MTAQMEHGGAPSGCGVRVGWGTAEGECQAVVTLRRVLGRIEWLWMTDEAAELEPSPVQKVQKVVPAGDDLAWQSLANCRGMDAELFFPTRGGDVRDMKAVCFECEVREECLEYSLKNGEKFGIWGGKSERERRRLRMNRSGTRSMTPEAIRQRECRGRTRDGDPQLIEAMVGA